MVFQTALKMKTMPRRLSLEKVRKSTDNKVKIRPAPSSLSEPVNSHELLV